MSKSDDSKKEILINDRIYDVSSFKHPGGSIIKFFYLNECTNVIPDATEVFHAFHSRFSKPTRILARLPSRSYQPSDYDKIDTPPSEKKLISDFNKLENEFQNEGFFEPSLIHVIYRLSEIFALFLFGGVLIFKGFPVLGLFILGIAQGRSGWLEHEGGHISLTGSKDIDIYIQTFVYTLADGMSPSYWRNQHNKHHAAPQRLKHDVDLDTLPLVAFNEKIGKLAGKFGRY